MPETTTRDETVFETPNSARAKQTKSHPTKPNQTKHHKNKILYEIILFLLICAMCNSLIVTNIFYSVSSNQKSTKTKPLNKYFSVPKIKNHIWMKL